MTEPERGGRQPRASERMRHGLTTSIVDNSSAFGFSITITATFGALSKLRGTPGLSEVFLFALSAAAAFGLLQALASSGFRRSPGAAPREVVMLGTALNVLSVGLAVGAATLTGLLLGDIAWPLGAFLAATVYVLVESAELAAAAAAERLRGQPGADEASE